MTTFIKHLDQPLTYKFEVEEDMEATYILENIDYISNVLENSAKITLNLGKTANTPSTFKHTFFQPFAELNGEVNILILISLAKDGHIITHQESGTHIERPFPGSL